MKNWYCYSLLVVLLSCTGSEYKSPINNLEEQNVPTDTGTCGIVVRKKTREEPPQGDEHLPAKLEKKPKQEKDNIIKVETPEERLKKVEEELGKQAQDNTPKFGLG